MYLENKASAEPAHRNVVQRSGIFGRQKMEELQPREAHIVSADAPVTWGKIPLFGKYGSVKYVLCTPTIRVVGPSSAHGIATLSGLE